ncbi:Phosphate:acyl-ACP acyltransferase PlsX [Fulvivirga imtechensis AK7]|uniref:Phosphate acyltransferase n=1 Tax=Fulvivirga imtechensis AK7 TaxID=1237149 RepID=L8JLE7_9BACT|nr:phosphate acyltransferase PlsX [Fulvivirga imtechensis]ELR68217.1 Phosphate:acyl-ACP acyltransferase PlsX [Fulvivirga imtechensis AK7]
MKIALDAMGGDFAPDCTVKGAELASRELPDDIKIVLVGKEDIIQSKLKEYNITSPSIEIFNADDVIDMGEHPTKALSQKPTASIPVGYGLLKSGAVKAFCSAGNTGAMHVGAMFTIKAIEGIIRPGIAGFIPKESGDFGVIIDVGANADCKPDVLYQFGEMGALYAKHVFNIENPKVGLMNLGEEEQKGTLLTQAAYQLFKISNKFNFVGNIEGRDLFNDKADVVVCDGFTGNVILKMAESFFDLLQKRNIIDPYFDRFNYEAIGGSPILGINGNVVIGHGVSSAEAIKNMILLSVKMAESNIHLKIKQHLGE